MPEGEKMNKKPEQRGEILPQGYYSCLGTELPYFVALLGKTLGKERLTG